MYEMFTEWTTTNMFIVPTLGIERSKLKENGLINAYIDDLNREIKCERAVYLLFKPGERNKFADFLEYARNKSPIIEEYDYGNLVMLVFQYAKKWEKDVKIIMTGKFSTTSTAFKESILKETAYGNLTAQHQIFKKDPSLEKYWKEKYGLDLNYNEDEYWPFYQNKETYEGIKESNTRITRV